MKKIILSILFVIIIISATFFLLREDVSEVDPAVFLPEQTSLFVEVRDLEMTIDSFLKSKIGKTLGSIDYEMLFRDLDIYELHYKQYDKIRSDMDEFLNSPFYKQILSRKVIASLIPTESAEVGDPISEAKEKLLFILKPKLNSSLIDLISYLNLEGTEQTSQEHGEHVIKSHHLKNGEVLITTKVANFILLSFNEKIIKDSLDRFDAGEGTLADYKDFKELREGKKNCKCKFFFYSSIQSTRKQIPSFLSTFDEKTREMILKELDDWNGWRTLAFGITTTDKKIYDRATILFDEDKIDPASKVLFLTPPEKNKTLTMAPTDVFAYHWANTFDPASIWKLIQKNYATNDKEQQRMSKEFKKTVGMKPDNFFKMFGANIVFFMTESNGKNFLPLPDFSFIVQLKKSEDAETLIEKYLKKYDIPVHSQRYKKRKLIFWGNAVQNIFQPVYTVYDQYLFVSSSVGLMEKIVNSIDSNEGLNVDPEFIAVNEDKFTGKNNSISFVRFQPLLRLGKELINWGGTIIGLQDRRVANQSRILIDNFINPLLDSMMLTFSTFHSRSHSSEGKIVFENQTVLVEEQNQKK